MRTNKIQLARIKGKDLRSKPIIFTIGEKASLKDWVNMNNVKISQFGTVGESNNHENWNIKYL